MDRKAGYSYYLDPAKLFLSLIIVSIHYVFDDRIHFSLTGKSVSCNNAVGLTCT